MVGPWLQVDDAVVRYGALTAVDGVSLDVARGEVVALLGASGSGKSSLLRAIAGLEPLASGRVLVDGEDVTGVPTHRRGFGMMFQDGQLFGHLRVGGNVAYGISRLDKDERLSRVDELLSLVGLAGYGSRRITELSGGQAQRVALARSLAPRPRLLLLDEPLSALDRGLRERMVGVLAEVLRGTGTTAVYVTHDQDEAFAIADRVAVLGEGRLWQIGRPEELWARPASRAVAEFLGYGPFVSPLVAAELGYQVGRGLVALADDSLVVADDAGAVVPVVARRFRVGGAEASVELPDGQAGVLRTAEPVVGDEVRVRIARAVSVDADG